MTGPARSLTERVYARVRADVLAGRLTPGQALRPQELAVAHGVSLVVVREALNRLAGERLVVAAAQRGFTVAEVSARDLADLTDVRVLVETQALRLSIEKGDLDWETRLVAAHHRLANTPMSVTGDDEITEEWMQAHNAFHAATMSACGNDRLIELGGSLGRAAALYRYVSHRLTSTRRDLAAEHRAIFEAAIVRDADTACRAHVDHVRRTADVVTKALTAAPFARSDS